MSGLFLATAAALSACAGPHADGAFATRASYGRLYQAALQAVPSVGYSVVSSNRADGVIVAQQGVIGGSGSTVGMNAQIINAGGERQLRVAFNAPPGTIAFGDFGVNLTDYIRSVRQEVPDLQAR